MAGSNRESSVTNPMSQNFEFNLSLSGDGANILGLGNFLHQEAVPSFLAALTAESEASAPGDPLETSARVAQRIESLEHSLDAAQRLLALTTRELGLREAGMVQPAGTGWEDEQQIAAGEQISLAQYGPSDQILQHSCLADPEFVAAGPPPGECREIIAERTAALPLIIVPDLDELRECMTEQAELRAAAEAHEIEADAISRRLQQQLNEKETLCANLVEAFDAWGKTDSVTQTKLLQHIANAHQASSANVRIWQIVCWFQTNVPESVANAMQALSDHYYQVALLNTELQDQERLLGNAPPEADLYTRLCNDESWAVVSAFRRSAHSDYRFGYVNTGEQESTNGFSAYIPTGEGAALAKHCLANLRTRLVRLSHASPDDRPVLHKKVLGFAIVAEHKLSVESALAWMNSRAGSKGFDLQMLDATLSALRSFINADPSEMTAEK